MIRSKCILERLEPPTEIRDGPFLLFLYGTGMLVEEVLFACVIPEILTEPGPTYAQTLNTLLILPSHLMIYPSTCQATLNMSQ